MTQTPSDRGPAEWNPDGEDEYFVIVEQDGREHFYRHLTDAQGAKAHAHAAGGKLVRGRMALRWETLREIRLGADDAY